MTPELKQEIESARELARTGDYNEHPCEIGYAETIVDLAEALAARDARIEKLREVVDALLQHEASTFFGPDAEKHVRASWRGVIRKARAALGETK